MTFSNTLWQKIEHGTFTAILNHPFLKGLTDGTLPQACFQHYILQDSLYLKDFGRGLAILATKANNTQAFAMFCQHAQTTVLVKQALHESFIQHWGLSTHKIAQTPIAPTCQLYTHYLLCTAHERPYEEALGAFLPCYWIYEQVGNKLAQQGSPNPLYQQWIDTYAGEAFAESVQGILKALNQTSQQLTQAQKETVTQHFLKATRLKWMFWDMSWRQEKWALPLQTPPTN